MSTTQQTTDVDIPEAGDHGGIGQAIRDYFTRVKGGDVGSLPAVLGLIVLFVFFSLMKPETFFTTFNFANLLNQGTAIIVLAMGLVFVLLLGEIDLSAGFTAGTAAAVLAVVDRLVGRAVAGRAGARPAHRHRDRPADRPAGRAPRHPVLRRDAGDVPRPAGRHAADHRRGRHHPAAQRRAAGRHEQEHAPVGRLAALGGRHPRLRASSRGGRSAVVARPGSSRRRRPCGLPRRSPWPCCWASWSSCSTSSDRSSGRARSRARPTARPVQGCIPVIQGVPWAVLVVLVLLVGLTFVLGTHRRSVGTSTRSAAMPRRRAAPASASR